METKYRWKVIVVIVLSAMILGLLAFLQFGSRISLPSLHPVAAATPTPTATPTAVATPALTPQPTPTPTATPEVVDVTSDDSLIRIVNRDHTLSEDYVPADLRSVDVYKAKDVQLRDEAAASLEQMFAAAQADDVYLKLIDGYRSYKEQRSLYYTYLNANGSGYVNKIDDIPGASEHQLGLAADIGNYNGACELQTCFKDYSSYRWLSEHAADYGWIERFPQGRQSVTGVVYSPWHYRYVGVEEAKKIKASGLTMEEYYQLVPETSDGANE